MSLNVLGKLELTLVRHTTQFGGYVVPFQRHTEADHKLANLET